MCPRSVYSNASTLSIRTKIDAAYKEWMEDHQGLTSWLITDEAKNLFAEAVSELNNWEVKYSENQTVLQQATDYLDATVPSKYTALLYTVGCSGL